MISHRHKKNEARSSFSVEEHTQYGSHIRTKKEKPLLHAAKIATKVLHLVNALKLRGMKFSVSDIIKNQFNWVKKV